MTRLPNKFVIEQHKSILHLTLHRQFFDQIAARTKRIEYRSDTPYWRKRLLEPGAFRKFDEIHFRNGYSPASPFMRVAHIVTDFGDGPYGQGFRLHLGDILELRNAIARENTLTEAEFAKD